MPSITGKPGEITYAGTWGRIPTTTGSSAAVASYLGWLAVVLVTRIRGSGSSLAREAGSCR